MVKYRKVISAGLVAGFAATMAVLAVCTLNGTALCPMTGGASTAEGPAVGARYDCCLTCAANAGVVNGPGFSVPAISILPLARTGFIPAAAMLSSADLPAPADGQAPYLPVFLLNAAFLI